ncbi:MAG: SBBP repeat-containing protein [Candidatus Zixiibacteriota bacterium]
MTRILKFPAKIPFLFCTLFCLWPCFTFSQQVDTAWVRHYNGPGNAGEVAEAISLDTQGNIYVTGYAIGPLTPCDYLTIKYYPNGDTAWIRSFRTEGSGCNYASNSTVDLEGNV